MHKDFPGCHVEYTKNAMAAWNYCGKEEGRQEGPLEHGVPPAAKNVKGDTASRNKMILEYGVVKAVENGLIPIEKARVVKQCIDLIVQMKADQEDLPKHNNFWYWGKTGTGKSYTAR